MVPVQNREIAKKIRHKKSKKNLKTQFKNGQTEKSVNIVETICRGVGTGEAGNQSFYYIEILSILDI